MKNNFTAYVAWCTLENLFHDNQASRTIYLQNKFPNTHLDQFPNMSDYCQAMKPIFDQLTNLGSNITKKQLVLLGSNITEKQLVLQILTGLNDQYESISLIIQQTDPLPDFFNTRSRLCQVEDRKATHAKIAAQQAGTALSATTYQTRSTTSKRSTNRTESDRSRGCGLSRGIDRSNFGRGRPQNTYPAPFGPNSYWAFPPWAGPTSQNYSLWAQWNQPPPCPYPLSPATNPTSQGPPPGNGILGPRPSHSSSAQSYNTGHCTGTL
ncbi:hypothetical protein HanIR_Chr03g0123621 [Helianthus annuus]|nr:hypothetical protein HanIR_Chr03g0123621 [Helianthus annuus]